MKFVLALLLALLSTAPFVAFAGENLRIDLHIDYSSDSQDGVLITSDHMEDGFIAGKPACILMYGEG